MPGPSGVALLLSQLGRHVSTRFAARMAELDLTPEHVSVLRVVGQRPGLSQAALAESLCALPSRVVRLVDELEGRGLVERRRSSTDRRNYELHTVPAAADRLGEVFAAVVTHDAEMTRGLSAAERTTLVALLTRLATAQGLEVDPGGDPSKRAVSPRSRRPAPRR